MEQDRAKEIINALADGVDPYTGDRFPADGPYQRADTVRALHAALDALESGAKPKKPVDPNKPHAGGRWTPEEEQRLRDAFNAQKPIEQIAKDHGRTPGAITARLVKLGLIEDNPTNRAGQGNRPAGNHDKLAKSSRCASDQKPINERLPSGVAKPVRRATQPGW